MMVGITKNKQNFLHRLCDSSSYTSHVCVLTAIKLYFKWVQCPMSVKLANLTGLIWVEEVNNSNFTTSIGKISGAAHTCS